MRSRLFRTLVAFLLTLITSVSNAAFIVDTGAGTSSVVGGLILGEYTGAGITQWLAGQFTTASRYTLVSVEGWISLSEPGTFGTVAIYSDSGGLPGTELFSSTFEGAGFDPQWLGVTGRAWDLAPGTYWAAFEVRLGQTLEAAMDDVIPNPLAAYAIATPHPELGDPYILEDLAVGIRIGAVPLPPALFLFATGLLGLVGVARREAA
jgi:hypothetical protein